MVFRVSLSPSAIADAESAYLWYKQQNQALADAWFNELTEAINSLENFPARCPVAAESKDLDREVRQLIYRKSKGSSYRILFGISESEVYVYRIRHTAQEYLTTEELGE